MSDVDEMIRSIDPVDGDDFARSWSASPAKRALFEEIGALTVTNRDVTDEEPRRRRRLAVIPTVVLAVLGVAGMATAVGVAVSTGDVGDSTSLACATPDTDDLSIIDATSGDPVQDCANEWERLTGEPAPPSTAYANGSGGIVVVPDGQAVPDDWQPLELGRVQDPAVIELDASIQDIADGLRSRCHLLEEGRAVVMRELERLDLEAWTVRSERGEADGTTTCTVGHLEPGVREVVLIPMDGVVPPPGDPIAVFGRAVGSALTEGCVDLAEAAAIVSAVSEEGGLTPDQVVVQEVEDPRAPCTRVEVVVGGSITVTLRGSTT